MNNFPAGNSVQGMPYQAAQVDIVIVNWNSGEQIANCISSIARYGGTGVAAVIVVDNGSTDRSADDLGTFDLPFKLVRNAKNVGFARACNQGASAGNSPYVLFLNPDTLLFGKSIASPLAFLCNPDHRDVGICGIQLVDGSGSVARTCARQPTLLRLIAGAIGLNKLSGVGSVGMAMRGWDHSSTRVVDQVIGAFFFTRRHLFESLQGFDERFFVYFEEVDFSCRARLAGWKTVYLSEAQAFHEGGGTSRQVKARRLFYSLRSRLLYGFKHFPLWQAWVLVAVTLFVEPVARVAFCLGRGQLAGVRDTTRGYAMLWGAFRSMLRSRGGVIK